MPCINCKLWYQLAYSCVQAARSARVGVTTLCWLCRCALRGTRLAHMALNAMQLRFAAFHCGAWAVAGLRHRVSRSVRTFRLARDGCDAKHSATARKLSNRFDEYFIVLHASGKPSNRPTSGARPVHFI